METENVPSPSQSSPVKKGYMHFDSGSDTESHDSGFSDKICASSFISSTGSSVRSTVFADEETEDGFTFLFDLDTKDEPPVIPSTFTNLFTKPLSETGGKAKLLSSNQDPIHPEKKRACRRLCMTSDSALCRAGSASMPSSFFSRLKERKSNHGSSNVSDTNAKTVCHNKSSDYTDDIENSSKHANTSDVTFKSLTKSPFKRPEPPENLTPLRSKRQKCSPISYSMKLQLASAKKPGLQSSFSESQANIMEAVQKSTEDPDLIGDFSKPYILPLINGRHQDMRTVTSQTLAQLMMGELSDTAINYKVVDCRYPYEFKGGHIKGALNIYTREDIVSRLLSNTSQSHDRDQRSIVIFHCEFSSERAPNLCRFLRNQDRECNKDSYPRLCHPELYLLEGGYKAFFESFKELCEPQNYTPMLHKDHEVDLRHFRTKSKSWSGGQRKTTNLRMGRKFKIV